MSRRQIERGKRAVHRQKGRLQYIDGIDLRFRSARDSVTYSRITYYSEQLFSFLFGELFGIVQTVDLDIRR
jgi:hypothetical protein